jgi:glycosyltransferase involved in cell wall biosynthesis
VNVVRGEPDGWLVPPDDEEALADAIVAAVGNAAERRRRGEHGARHVHRTYSWRTVAGRFADLYREVGGSP